MKTRASNLHHERGMEKTIDHLNREIVKLREELVSVETKTRRAVEAAPNPSNLSVFLFRFFIILQIRDRVFTDQALKL